jgi:RNA recognition motif-containing protein
MSRLLEVRNIPFDISEQLLKNFFEIAGPVEHIMVLNQKSSCSSGQTALIKMKTARGVKNVLERLRKIELQGRRLKIELILCVTRGHVEHYYLESRKIVGN